MSLVGKKAPLFRTYTIANGNEKIKEFSFDDVIGQKEIVLFICPRDATFGYPTALYLFQTHLHEFEKRNVKVIGVCTDIEETQLKGIFTEKNEDIKCLGYPLIMDTSKTISVDYGVLGGFWKYDDNGILVFDDTPINFRGIFYIDKKGIVRHEFINFLSMIRTIKETLLVVDAWRYYQGHDEIINTDL